MNLHSTIKRAFAAWGMLLGMLSAILIGPAYAEPQIAISVGGEYRTGDYGGSDDIDDFFVPVSVSVQSGELVFQLTVPYVRAEGPEGSLIGPSDTLPGSGREVSESGLGDIVASATLRDLYMSANGDFVVDLTGSIKAGTADENDGLGTGETDYALQIDFYRFFDRGTLFGVLGYKVRGDSDEYDLRNTMFTQLGASSRIAEHTSIGAALSYRPKVISSGDAATEATLFASQDLGHDVRLTAYGLAGLTDGSPDWGAGFTLKFWL